MTPTVARRRDRVASSSAARSPSSLPYQYGSSSTIVSRVYEPRPLPPNVLPRTSGREAPAAERARPLEALAVNWGYDDDEVRAVSLTRHVICSDADSATVRAFLVVGTELLGGRCCSAPAGAIHSRHEKRSRRPLRRRRRRAVGRVGVVPRSRVAPSRSRRAARHSGRFARLTRQRARPTPKRRAGPCARSAGQADPPGESLSPSPPHRWRHAPGTSGSRRTGWPRGSW